MVYGRLFGRLIAEQCPGCGNRSRGGFCEFCRSAWRRIERPCPRCALAMPVTSCPRRAGVWTVDTVVAPFEYGPPIDHYVHALKYRDRRALGRAFGLALAPELSVASVDALVAVPLHAQRIRQRGYNQSFEIARALRLSLRIPLLQRGIARITQGAAQTGQSAIERRLNVARAFAVRRRDLRSTRIAIIDDVITTGATVNALATALLAAGAESCVAWAVARTPESEARQLRKT